MQIFHHSLHIAANQEYLTSIIRDGSRVEWDLVVHRNLPSFKSICFDFVNLKDTLVPLERMKSLCTYIRDETTLDVIVYT